MSFTKKILSVQLGNTTITAPGEFTDLRISCKINKNGDSSMANMEMGIYGLPLSLMNQLTLLGSWQFGYTNQTRIIVKAGDAESGLFEIFTGTIQMAWTDAQAMPKVNWRVYAVSGIFEAKEPAPVTTVDGQAKADDLLKKIAAQMGKKYQSYGVDQVVESPYHPRSAHEQAMEICQSAGLNCMIDGDTFIAVGPKGNRGGNVTLSPKTGMVGYPGFNQQGIVVKSLFNPKLIWFGTVTVESDLKPACGQWTVTNVVHELESEVPHGLWFTSIAAIRPVGSGLK